MAHRGAPLRHVVSTTTPQGLSGVDHKVCGQEEALPHGPPQRAGHRRTGGASLIHGTCTERGKPYRSRKGKLAVRRAMGVRVWDAGASEGHPVMGWRGVEHMQYHPTRKRADFPLVSHHEKI